MNTFKPSPPQLSLRERRFRYRAKTTEGKTVCGTALAPDRNTLSRRLHGQGLYLLSAAEQSDGSRRMLKNVLLSELFRHLAGLLSSGISLARALSIASAEEGLDRSTRRVCASMLSGVRSGVPLSQTMEREGVFPELVLGMVYAGESSGALDVSMERLAIHYEKQHRMEQSLRSALTYPALLCFMALLVTLGVFTLVLPQFNELFEGLGTLPLPTRLLMSMSDFLVERWYLVPLTIVCAAAAARGALQIPAVRLWADRQKLRLPLAGSVLKTVYTARFARSLASLYASGTPILSALGIAGDALGNTYLKGQFDDLLSAVRSGSSLSAALKAVDGFRSKLVSAVEVGEESGRLDAMLEGIASTMEFDARHAAKRLITVIEPVLIVLMALMVGFIMIGVMLPIVQSYGVLESTAYI